MNNALPQGFVLNGVKSYTIVKPLHSGGFGITYLVKAEVMDGNIPIQAFYTIKEFFLAKSCIRDTNQNVVASSPSAQQLFADAKSNFLDEANVLHGLQHKNIVPVNEVFQQNNTVYYVMKYLGETSLEQYVRDNGGTLPEADAISIITSLAYAVGYLHDNKILHLDIKPNNIMVCREQGTVLPVLIDFGQACFPKSKNKVRGYSSGFSPAELKDVACCPDKTADVYSLAATLISLLTGKTPEDAASITKAKIYRMMPDNISERTSDTIVRAMCSSPLDRLQSVQAFLASLLNNEGTETEVIVVSKSFPIKTVASIVAGIVLLVACVFGIGMIDFNRSTDKQDTTTVDADSTSNVSLQPQEKDTTQKQQEKQEPTPPEKPQKNATPESKPEKPSAINQHTAIPQKQSGPTNGTVDLGYAVWTGETLNGKPHGTGTMRFKRSHLIAGCTNEAYSGCYVEGFCEKGVLMSGTLYDDSGNKMEDFVR